MKRRKSYNKYRYVNKKEKKTEKSMTFEDAIREEMEEMDEKTLKERIRENLLVKTAMLNIMIEEDEGGENDERNIQL